MDGIALISASFFALHPVQVETVAWASELKGALAALFALSGLLFHLRSNKRMKINPKSYLGAFCIGDELIRAGQIDEAIKWLEKSHSIKPDYLAAVLTLGMAYARSGQPGRAVELYECHSGHESQYHRRPREVRGFDPQQFGHAADAGRAHRAGVQHLKKAVAVFPNALNAHLNLGNVAFASQRYTEAIAEYETARSLSPDSRAIEQRLELARRQLHSQ